MKRQIQFSILVFLMLFFIGCGGRQSTSIKAKVEAPSVESLPRPGYFFTPGLPMFAPTPGLERTALEKRIRQRLADPGRVACTQLPRSRVCGTLRRRRPRPVTVNCVRARQPLWILDQSSKEYSVTVSKSTSWKLTSQRFQTPHSGRQRIGVVRHADGRVTLTPLTPPNNLSFSPFQRSGPLQVAGRLRQGDGTVEFWFQANRDAPAKRLPVKIGPTGDFRLATQAPDGARLEVARRQGRFRNTIAVFNLNSKKTNQYIVFDDSAQTENARQRLIQHVNAFRTKKKLPKLSESISFSAESLAHPSRQE